MKVFCAPERQKVHYPRGFLVNGAQQPNPEVPERVDRLVLVASGGLGREVNLALRSATLPGAAQVLIDNGNLPAVPPAHEVGPI